MKKTLFTALMLAAATVVSAQTLTLKPVADADQAIYQLVDVQRVDLTSPGQAVVVDKMGTSTAYNTSEYSLVFTSVETDGIEEVKDALEMKNLKVWADETAVYVAGVNQGEQLALFSLNGMVLARSIAAGAVTRIDMSGAAAGIYIVKAGNQAVKIIKK